MQSYPPTKEEQKYDDTSREYDRLITEIGTKSMALFTAEEFLWFMGYVYGTRSSLQNVIDLQVNDLCTFLQVISGREPK